MTPVELLKPWRIIVSMIPCLYAALLMLEMNDSWFWGLLAIVLVVVALWVVSMLGYPVSVFLPSYAGLFLLIACAFVLYAGMPAYGLLPATRSPIELWAAIVLGLAYVAWGVRGARHVLSPV